jgi:hypothetical protein
LTEVLIAGQVLCFIADWMARSQGNPPVSPAIWLDPAKVVSGEVWRLVTFLFQPPTTNPLFAFFAWYLFYLMASALENQWGTFRYFLYLLIGYVASLVSVFVFSVALGTPGAVAPNAFLYGTVFLAFARLYPDFTLMLMFILPVKVKWLALLTWISYAYQFLFGGSWLVSMMVVAAVSNFLLFFGREIVRDMRHGHQRMRHQARVRSVPSRITHECRVCGLSSETSPRTAFRYCTQCAGQACYCPEHIRDHEHVAEKSASSSR